MIGGQMQIVEHDGDAAKTPSIQDTALPYIDQHLEHIPQMKEYVNQLIAEEMKQFSPPDYLAHMPKPECEFTDRPSIRTELKRIAARQPTKPIDKSRYRVDPPPSAKQNDEAAWGAALHNAMAQVQHQELRLENLELMQAYGPAQTKVQNDEFETIKVGMTAQNESLKRKTEDINKQRKIEQMQAGERLHSLEGKWQQLVYNNRSIETACENLEREVKRMKDSAGDGTSMDTS